MSELAAGDLSLPAGIQWSDLAYISERVLVIALVIIGIGILVLRRVAGRSIALMVTVVVAVSVITSMAGVGVIAYRMVGTSSERDDILDLMAIAGLAGLVVALFVGRRLTKASHAISSAVQNVSESGVYVAPPMTLPTELSELSGELAATHERLGRCPRGPGRHRSARGVPVPHADPPRGGPADPDDRRPVRAVPDPRGCVAAVPAHGRPRGPGRRGRGQRRAGGQVEGRPADRGCRPRHAGLRRLRGDGPGPAQPGDQRDQAHAVGWRGRRAGRGAERDGLRERVGRLRWHSAR